MQPFSAFNFKVRLQLDGEYAPGRAMAPSRRSAGSRRASTRKTIREGGNNLRQIHLPGPVSYGQLTLKRGMTDGLDLWRWFRQVNRERALRASGEIAMLSADRERETLRFALTGCLPLKLKAPTLNATDGIVAIEEMQVAYETLELAAG